MRQKGWPQTNGVLYGVSPPKSTFSLFIVTDKRYKKVQNIQNDPRVSFLILFPHYYIRFAPSNTIQFQGTAELIPLNNQEILAIFQKGPRILRRAIQSAFEPNHEGKWLFIKIKPKRQLVCFGLGIGPMRLRKNHPSGRYIVEVPSEKR